MFFEMEYVVQDLKNQEKLVSANFVILVLDKEAFQNKNQFTSFVRQTFQIDNLCKSLFIQIGHIFVSSALFNFRKIPNFL